MISIEERIRRKIISNRKYRETHKVRIREHMKIYHKLHPEVALRGANKYRQKHHDKLLKEHNELAKMNKHRVITYKGKRYVVKTSPRSDRCEECGRMRLEGERYFDVIHNIYDDSNILAHIKELCRNCKAKIAIRDSKGRFL